MTSTPDRLKKELLSEVPQRPRRNWCDRSLLPGVSAPTKLTFLGTTAISTMTETWFTGPPTILMGRPEGLPLGAAMERIVSASITMEHAHIMAAWRIGRNA